TGLACLSHGCVADPGERMIAKARESANTGGRGNRLEGVMIRVLFFFLSAFATPGWAQHRAPPGVDPNQFKPLPDRNDVVSWKVLSQVELVKQKDRYVPQFAAAVAALDQKEVKVQGFMMPLQMGDRQSHFVLTAMPQSCSFCM